jgi:hypothetical protein
MVCSLFVVSSAQAQPRDEVDGQASGELPAVTNPSQDVEVGFYPISVYSLDLASNTFYADMYVWFAWRGELDPTESMEFVNGVEQWGMTKKKVYEEPDLLPDGRYLQQMRVEGRFFVPFELQRFPFDEHDLAIVLEDSTYTTAEIRYVADNKNSGIGDALTIPGWNLDGWDLSAASRNYTTDFGDPRVDLAENSYPQARFTLRITRSVYFFVFKLFLPLVIVLLLCWSALLVSPERVEVRTAIPATGLLTAVFLQLSYSSSLPDVSYLTMLDKIYVLAYILVILVLGHAIFIAHRLQASGGSETAIARARRFDYLMVASQVTVFGGFVATLLLS